MKLSIIIIEYKCMNEVYACLRSVNEHLGDVSYECVVLSNSGYSENEISDYRDRLTNARLIPARGNLGYAGGVNAALKEIDGDYIYILNPDCLLTDSGVTKILEAMSKEPGWGVAGPKVVDDQGNVQPSCRRFPRPWTFFLVRSSLNRTSLGRRESARYFMSDISHDGERMVDWVSGGALIVRRDAMKKVGGMDERYFLYMEDVDLCQSMKKHGYTVKYRPDSIVIHSGKHASIKGGLRLLSSRNFRWHLTSLAKYFIKWSV